MESAGDDPFWPAASGPDMYTTDWSPRRHRKGRRRARGRAGRTVSILLVVGAAVAGGGYVAVHSTVPPPIVPATVDAALEPRPSIPPAATRGRPRPAPSVSPSATIRKATPKSTRPPEPVAGLTQAQMNNAAVIVQVAREMGLPRRAMLVAMMTGLQESSLRNLANTTVPASLDRPNEGDGANFDSLGIFQQRPSQGWGTVAQLMTPRYAANAFYEKLIDIADWESKSLGDAAQAVQRSALPDAYADHQDRAEKVVDALL
ncbi:hypothetical protein SAMN05421541_11936 [Actinoplanes philippinensis]|uniref:Peptidase M23 n=1 Tax=Actinoplanes philippinensis TaxID=35752 RepID=A0A1I2KY11_9ACTN|nr:hypothetical protein [Actinoplanes philippinensis]SFF71904.1 hypothetical protein SAMN05421541_11936 [Actinoplanes philippinensis]